jgi:hypothetical protein
MRGLRLLAAWLVVVSSMVAFSGLGAYSTGILVHHGQDPSEILYGWPAVWYLCPRIALGLVAVTVIAGICVALLK